MIRAATVHARLLLSRSYVVQAKAASRWPVLLRKPSYLGCVRPFYQMDPAGQDENNMLTARGCHSSPQRQELANRSCVPCNSKDLHPMSEDSAKKFLEQVHGWEMTTEGGILKLHRAWKVKNFVKGLEFFQLVAGIAEEEGHHPDLHLVGWNNVKIDIWTHSVRGLTDNDFILAAKINNLNLGRVRCSYQPQRLLLPAFTVQCSYQPQHCSLAAGSSSPAAAAAQRTRP